MKTDLEKYEYNFWKKIDKELLNEYREKSILIGIRIGETR